MKCVFRLSLIAIAILGANVAQASAQTPRFEVGGQLEALRLSDFKATNLGLGGRLTFAVTRLVALEGEFNFFPHDDVTVVGSPGLGIAYQRRRSEAFFGTKIGVRGQRVGVFGRVRPGFTRLTHQGMRCDGDDCARILMLLVLPVYRTEFALDVGGGVEFFPSQRTVARFDVGSTIVRHESAAPPCWGNGCTSQDFSSRFSIGLRF